MCGRYAASRSPEDLAEEFSVEQTAARDLLAPSWNVAPTDTVYAVVQAAPDRPGCPRRELRVMRWGLLPPWAQDRRVASRHINARAETAADKPAYRAALRLRRCLLPADGWYEWYAGPAGSGRVDRERGAGKMPYFLHRADGRPLALAGLYERWRDRDRDPQDVEAIVLTCTILTTTAHDDIRHLHDRMPLIVPPVRYAAWLDPGRADPGELLALVRSVDGLDPGARLVASPVSRLVGDVRNNGPHLLVPDAPAPDALF